MADQENNNCIRVTRLAKKRAMEAIGSHLQPANKKRIVLGELSNNAGLLEDHQKRKCGSKKVKKSVKEVKMDVKEHEFDVDVVVDGEKINDALIDPQLCEAYASDIYDYLCNMEVCNFIHFSTSIAN